MFDKKKKKTKKNNFLLSILHDYVNRNKEAPKDTEQIYIHLKTKQNFETFSKKWLSP